MRPNNETSGSEQSAEGLREQREWLRVTLSSIGDAVITTDTNGSVKRDTRSHEGCERILS